jgi:hypothetical protein
MWNHFGVIEMETQLHYVTLPDGRRCVDPFVVDEVLAEATAKFRAALRPKLFTAHAGDTIKINYVLNLLPHAPDVQD